MLIGVDVLEPVYVCMCPLQDVICLCASDVCELFTCMCGSLAVTTLGKLFTPICICHQAVYLATGRGTVMLCGWEGNRRPDGK